MGNYTNVGQPMQYRSNNPFRSCFKQKCEYKFVSSKMLVQHIIIAKKCLLIRI